MTTTRLSDPPQIRTQNPSPKTSLMATNLAYSHPIERKALQTSNHSDIPALVHPPNQRTRTRLRSSRVATGRRWLPTKPPMVPLTSPSLILQTLARLHSTSPLLRPLHPANPQNHRGDPKSNVLFQRLPWTGHLLHSLRRLRTQNLMWRILWTVNNPFLPPISYTRVASKDA